MDQALELNRRPSVMQWALAILFLLLPLQHAIAQGPAPAPANAIKLQPPAPGVYVLDVAGLLDADQTKQINEAAHHLLTETAVPLYVVTLQRLADHGPAGISIETYARILYDQWGIGHLKINGQPYNRGMLLLVARSDRAARIELGAGFGSRMDQQSQWIMDNRILPRFKANNYGEGIVAGSMALGEMARGELKTSGLQATVQSNIWAFYTLGAGFLVLLLLTVISLHRSGRHGWAFIGWGIFFATSWVIIKTIMTNRGGGGRGGFGGGFGGGFSGGGGASGRW